MAGGVFLSSWTGRLLFALLLTCGIVAVTVGSRAPAAFAQEDTPTPTDTPSPPTSTPTAPAGFAVQRLSPDAQPVALSDPAIVDVTVEDVTDLGAFEIAYTFDGALLSCLMPLSA